MPGNTIATVLNHGIVLGTKGYAGPVYIIGGIQATYGMTGILMTTAAVNPTVANSGFVDGGSGSPLFQISASDYLAPGTGGVGIVIQTGKLINSGDVSGGSGGNGAQVSYNQSLFYPELFQNGNGAAGVDLQGGTVINSGNVTGGNAGKGVYLGGGYGGAGIFIQAGTLMNSGTVKGGGTDGSGLNALGGGGAAGVTGAVAAIVNTGLIAGSYAGTGNKAGADGIDLASGNVQNNGTILGGRGTGYKTGYQSSPTFGIAAAGGDAVALGANATFTNLLNGIVVAGAGSGGIDIGGSGGDGVILGADGRAFNQGSVTGGAGGNGVYDPGTGGTGLVLSSDDIAINQGIISGGAVGYALNFATGSAGNGVFLNTGAKLFNEAYTSSLTGIITLATISGGPVVSDFRAQTKENAGEGVVLTAGASLINGAFIDGGSASKMSGYAAETGGVGISNLGGSVLNSGTVIGGVGGTELDLVNSPAYGGNGGVGIYSTGLIVNSGTIVGGSGGVGSITSGAQGDAVDGGTLVVDPSAVFIGAVHVATLEVAGSVASTLSGFGDQFTATDAVIFDPGSTWTIKGSIAGLSDGQAIDGFTVGETLILVSASVTSETYISGTGLELGVGGSEDTLGITGAFSTGDFDIANGPDGATITVQPVTVPFVISAPTTFAIVAGNFAPVTGVSLAGDSGKLYTVKLTDRWALLSATGAGVSGISSKALTIMGSLAEVNADLATLEDNSGESADRITITATDGASIATQATIGVSASYPLSIAHVVLDARQIISGLTLGDGASEVLEAGAKTYNIVPLPGAVQLVLSGATTTDTILEGGMQGVLGTANRSQINMGSYEIIGAGGQSVGGNIDNGGYQYVFAGGTAANTTIFGGGTMLVSRGATTSGVIAFANGDNAVLSITGTHLPTTQLSGFNQNGTTGDAIILTSFSYAAGTDTATLGAGNVLTIDLDGQIEKLNFNPGQSNTGKAFSITTNSLDQVVIIDPLAGTSPNMDFLAPATAAGSRDMLSRIIDLSAALIVDIHANDPASASFRPALESFVGIGTLNMGAALGVSMAIVPTQTSALQLATFASHGG